MYITVHALTGFSFGGMLALSVTASLWKMPLISTSVLEKNLCCIVLSPPLINLALLQEVCSESPQILSTLHSIFLHDDFVPRLTMFLDSRNEKICSESYTLEEVSCASQVCIELLYIVQFCYSFCFSLKTFQGLFSSNLLHHIGRVQATTSVKVYNYTAVEGCFVYSFDAIEATIHLYSNHT